MRDMSIGFLTGSERGTVANGFVLIRVASSQDSDLGALDALTAGHRRVRLAATGEKQAGRRGD